MRKPEEILNDPRDIKRIYNANGTMNKYLNGGKIPDHLKPHTVGVDGCTDIKVYNEGTPLEPTPFFAIYYNGEIKYEIPVPVYDIEYFKENNNE